MATTDRLLTPPNKRQKARRERIRFASDLHAEGIERGPVDAIHHHVEQASDAEAGRVSRQHYHCQSDHARRDARAKVGELCRNSAEERNGQQTPRCAGRACQRAGHQCYGVRAGMEVRANGREYKGERRIRHEKDEKSISAASLLEDPRHIMKEAGEHLLRASHFTELLRKQQSRAPR